MKFKLDFDDLEELQKLLGEVAESVEEFEEAFSNIIDEVAENSSGKALEKITEISEDLLPTLKDVAIGYQDQADIAKDYIEGIREINEDKDNVYELDTSEAKGYIKDITNQLEDTEYLDTDTPGLVYFTASYDNQVKSYYEIDSSLNLDEEYDDDEETKALIRSKRTEINNYISNYNYNQTQLEDAQDIMTELNKTMSSYIEDLADYKDVLEDLKDFEDRFNPGFWDKHGKVVAVVGAVVAVAALWEVGVLAAAAELIASGLTLVVATGETALAYIVAQVPVAALAINDFIAGTSYLAYTGAVKLGTATSELVAYGYSKLVTTSITVSVWSKLQLPQYVQSASVNTYFVWRNPTYNPVMRWMGSDYTTITNNINVMRDEIGIMKNTDGSMLPSMISYYSALGVSTWSGAKLIDTLTGAPSLSEELVDEYNNGYYLEVLTDIVIEISPLNIPFISIDDDFFDTIFLGDK